MESGRVILIRIVNIIGGIIGFFLAARIVLRLLSASPTAPIVSWIYSVSGGLVYPFHGIFKDISLGGMVFDLSAVIALIVYAVVFSIIVTIINAIVSPIIVRSHREAPIH